MQLRACGGALSMSLLEMPLWTFSFKLKINPGGLLHPCIQPLNLIFWEIFRKAQGLKRYSGRMFYNCSVPPFYITITLEKNFFFFLLKKRKYCWKLARSFVWEKRTYTFSFPLLFCHWDGGAFISGPWPWAAAGALEFQKWNVAHF